MNDQVTCEGCGKPGERKLLHVAPTGWFFAALHYPEAVPHPPGDRMVAVVCSETCRDSFWTKQKDQTLLDLDRGVNVPEEIRTASWHVAKQLRDEASRLAALPYASVASTIFAKLLDEAANELSLATETELEYLAAAEGNAGVGGA